MMKGKESLGLLRDLLSRGGRDWREPNLGDDGCLLITFVNPLTVSILNRNPGYADVLRRFDVVHPDGVLLARHASRVLGYAVPRQSFDGNSLAPEVFAHCARYGLKVGFVGGVESVAVAASGRIREAFGISVAYSRHGFFSSAEEKSHCYEQLKSGSIDVLVCGMGAPYQDEFLVGLKDSGWNGLAFTCGGYLDQVVESGIEYYPRIINRLNLRAPYRLLREPRRLWRRYLVEYTPFLLADLGERLARSKERM